MAESAAKRDAETQLDRIERLLRELHRDFRALKQRIDALERRLVFTECR